MSPHLFVESQVWSGIVDIKTIIELGGNGTQARLMTGDLDHRPFSWCGVTKEQGGHDRLVSRSCGENPMATN